MDRDLDVSTAAALAGEKLWPIGLVHIAFDSGDFRMWTGIGELVWDGYTWTGAGTLGRISEIEETAEQRAVGVEMVLSGVPQEVLDIAIAEDWQGRETAIYYGVLNDQRQFDGPPFQIFGGFIDRMRLVYGAEASITVSLESDDIDLERTKVRRWTAEDTRNEYPEDKFCDAVTSIQEVDIKWGRGFEKDT